MDSLGRLDTVPLFPPLHLELVTLLRGLDDADWVAPTLAPRWSVRDVAAHLLDGDLRKLSGGRDGRRLATRPLTSFAEVVAFIDGLNAEGVAFGAKLSPRVLTDLVEVTGRWVSDHVASLDPLAPAHIPVSWADEDQSANWMDCAREYTERWHHQMQIREATGRPRLLDERWLRPLLDVSVRAFRRAYKPVDAPIGTTVSFEVAAEVEYAWAIVRQADAWVVFRGRPDAAVATVRVSADDAWKLLYNALSADAIRQRVVVEGDASLAAPMLRARSVMA